MAGQPVCFFCALRYTSKRQGLALATSHNARRYLSRNSVLRQPAGAAAQRREEEDDEDEIVIRRYHTKEPPMQRPETSQHGQRSVFDDLVHPRSSNHSPRGQRDRPASRYEGASQNQRYNPQSDRQVPSRRTDAIARHAEDVSASVHRGYNQESAFQSRLRSQQSAYERRNEQLKPMREPLFSRPANAQQQQKASGWRPLQEPTPTSSAPRSPFEAFSEAVRTTGQGQDTPRRRGHGAVRGRDPRTPFGASTRRDTDSRDVASGSSIEILEEETTLDQGDADQVEDHKKNRRRASREERYAIERDESQMSEEALKAQRVRDRAKEREFERIEALLEEEAGGRRRKKKNPKPQVKSVQQSTQRRIDIPEFITVQNMSQALNLRLEVFLEKLEDEGFEGARHDHLLDASTASMLAEMYDFEPVLASAGAQQDLVARPPAEDPSILPPRPPIVTIMGHVDHGKTTILDYLRKANVVASEHGGITQHIGAFSVVMPRTERQITFLDTPGHAAFLDMRRRGANVTDIVVLVVAADDSVKPQTKEAIKHALDAGVQIIVAINKVDKGDADLERVKADLAMEDILVEDRGGEYQAIAVSGKTGQGMEDLEEAIITLADVSDYRAETEGAAEGWIIESKVTSAGRVATVLVRRGTLRTGDFIVAGSTWARVRTLRNETGELVSEALPGTPVQIDGWRGEDPTAGLEVLQADDEQHAKAVVDLRIEKAESLRAATDLAAINASRSEAAEARAKILAWQAEQGMEQGLAAGKQSRIRLRDTRTGWMETENDAGPRKVHFVVKADVAGSVEAIVAAVSRIGNDMVQANVIHSGTGMLTESEVRMLATSGELCYAITFNQMVDGTIYRLAEAAGIEILDYNIIYKVTDAVKEKLTAQLPPLVTTKVLGEAEVGMTFDIKAKGKKSNLKIAGCRITNGTISRANKVRVLRNGETIFTGTLSSLKNVKKDVTEMRKGTECGMAFDGWEDMREGDNVQCFEEISEPRKLY